MKQLTKEEVQQLFLFVEKQGVKFYDIQLEVVDHLASEIEQNWEGYPTDWTFEQKILDIYSYIGEKGLLDMQTAKGRAFQKWFNSHSKLYIKSFFTWPKIVLSLVLMYLVFSVISMTDAPLFYGKKLLYLTLLLPTVICSTIILIWQSWISKYKYSNLFHVVLQGMFMPYTFILIFIIVPEWLYLNTFIASCILSIGYVLLLYFIVAFFLAVQKCYKEYKMQYPKLT